MSKNSFIKQNQCHLAHVLKFVIKVTSNLAIFDIYKRSPTDSVNQSIWQIQTIKIGHSS